MLARIIANSLDAEFFHLSGVLSKKDDVIKIISKSQTNFQSGRQTILFLDEIHRWSKSQQDTLLPWVEKGIITLIGATTENPSFTVNNALLSRCRTYVLQSLKPHDIEFFLKKHIETIESRFPNISLDDEALKLISEIGDGDLRNTLNLLETACILQQEGKISREIILESGNKNLNYDKNGEEHYNLISAMHKSLRDSDGDAVIYWIGRMLAGGEDPRYIVRRMMNFASEDVFEQILCTKFVKKWGCPNVNCRYLISRIISLIYRKIMQFIWPKWRCTRICKILEISRCRCIFEMRQPN